MLTYLTQNLNNLIIFVICYHFCYLLHTVFIVLRRFGGFLNLISDIAKFDNIRFVVLTLISTVNRTH